MPIKNSFFNELIQNIDIDTIPLEFILMAGVTDRYGREILLQNDEVNKVMRGPERKNLIGARVILDVKKIIITITEAINTVYAEINRRSEIRESVDKNNDI
jgi:hypothetical protein